MEEILRIGEFSKLNNISIQTLRYYESIDLLKPYFINSETNYRYYHILQSPIIDSIQFLKSCNLSLNEIKTLLDEQTNQQDFQTSLINHLNSLIEEKQKIDQQIKITESFLRNNKTYQDNLAQKSFNFHYFPTRHLYTYKISENIYDLSPLEYEWYLRKFKQHLVKNDLENLQFSHVGSIMKQEHVLNNQLISDTFFVFCQSNLKSLPNVVTLPFGSFAVDYCESFEKEKNAFKEFKEKVMASDKKIIGDYLCEVIREIPQSTKLQRNMFIRMQLPICDK